jgi:hypothetical protein
MTMSDGRPVPLAKDAAGVTIEIPEGATGWRIWQHTRGRPRVVLDQDREPLQLGLSATLADLSDTVGPGSYRLRPVSRQGEVVGPSVDHCIPGGDDDAPAVFAGHRGAVAARADREEVAALVGGLVEMGRALERVAGRLAEAQSAWNQTLATTRSLPKAAVLKASGEKADEQLPALRNATTEPTAEDEEDDEPEDYTVWAVARNFIDSIGGAQNLPHVAQFASTVIVDTVSGIRNKLAAPPTKATE